MSQQLDYPREVPAMWLDLAHVIAGAELPRSGVPRAMPSTERMAPATHTQARGAGVRHLAACVGAVVACLAWPGVAGLIDQLLG
jgi:hypothetical protein